MNPLDSMYNSLIDGSAVSISDDNYVSDSKARGSFARRVDGWKKDILEAYYSHGISLNTSIANIAQNNALNNEQISRIIEEVNSEVYLNEYSKKKRENVRDVEFEIADLQKIKDNLGSDDVANVEDKVDTSDSKMKKTASVNEDNLFLTGKYHEDEKVTSFNKTSYELADLSPESKVEAKDIVIKKLANILEKEYNELEMTKLAYFNELGDFVSALIEYNKLGLDPQEVFKTACEMGDVTKTAQIPILKAYENAEKPPYAREALELVDFLEKKADFSLGKRSLNDKKEVQLQGNNLQGNNLQGNNLQGNNLPTIITANKKIMKDYEGLVKNIQKIQSEQEKLQAKAEKVAMYEKVAIINPEPRKPKPFNIGDFNINSGVKGGPEKPKIKGGIKPPSVGEGDSFVDRMSKRHRKY